MTILKRKHLVKFLIQSSCLKVSVRFFVEHKPALTNGIMTHDHIMLPGNDQRQQHATYGPSPTPDVNSNYFTFSPSVTSSSTASVSAVTTEDRLLARVDHASPRADHASPHENHKSPRENNISPRIEINPGGNHVSPRPERPYQCGHCSSSFSLPSELSAHVVTHTNERPFKCGFCGRSFAGANTLYNHMRMHTGNRAFLCNKCGCTLDTASQLSRHMRTPGECPNGENVTREVVPPYCSR